ncbi:polyprenyl synthetase family protein [Nocardioides panacis]|uniref:Polyprenyl synthetase family protein n=1 Tax=Nocardioides panacis TaxID=2849501 RepID=A0A975XYL1_9ACTN|nr:polyprenyl synthetase family protein [Nocardioides panacis]QWZ06334.1 polyprenyl synthetase family protein [Nocardioides panacis]
MTSQQPSWDAPAFRADVQSALDAFVDEQALRLAPLGDDAARLVDAARAAVSGGKRFRAAFCAWGFRAVRDEGADAGALVRAAAALEVLHASALVHDDYMDASDTRRGRPATHKAFEAVHRESGWTGDPQQYGAAAAILLGDLLLSWSDELLRRCGMPHDVVRDALAFFDTTRSEVIAGQFLDVSVQARGASDVEQAMRVLRYKSAKYSIERPLHVGAALAGADRGTLAALTGFGLPLGEAFQLRDDLLGVYGDPDSTGKPAGDDLTEGKRTVLVALALEHAPDGDAKRLDEALGTALSVDEVADLRRIIDESGAHAAVERRIEELTTASLAALEAAAVTPASRGVLRELAAAATQRTL